MTSHEFLIRYRLMKKNAVGEQLYIKFPQIREFRKNSNMIMIIYKNSVNDRKSLDGLVKTDAFR